MKKKSTIAKSKDKPQKTNKKAKKPFKIAPRLPLKINNVTTTAWLGSKINLVDVSETLVCTYDRVKFPNGVYHERKPKCTILIFESGKIVTTGTRTPEAAQTAMYKLLWRLTNDLDDMWCISIFNFRVVNYVGNFSTGFELDLKKLRTLAPLQAKYNKNHFPALRLRLTNPKSVITVFRSGKVNISGAKTIEDLQKTYKKYNNFKDFKVISSYLDLGEAKDVDDDC